MLPAARRITRTAEFRRVYRQGRRVGSKALVLYWRPNDKGYTRFGFSVSKKIGRSVVRNRLKRLLREACRRHLASFRPGFDVVLVAREGIRGWGFKEVLGEVLTLGQQAKLLVDSASEGAEDPG
ncbi:MAG: ribonuclease P protein component [Thermanaeromonas sp.]|uniref:ribonuclease P protein component n=1 Tax=Thermanaeromonas sp. TaxID=2003697 RepID=UPI00243951FA|nr:ribonuclease P protein component [Thermanaeromonas sp.]MCG0277069.1 ribonuclease P protein component [Thermanaeromonas sp.]